MSETVNQEALTRLLKSAPKHFQKRTGEMEKLSDDALNKVAGGYIEPDNFQAKGWEICCNNCGASGYYDFEIVRDSSMLHVTEYRCNRCGYNFVVDGMDGGVWEKSSFLYWCNNEGIVY